MLACKQLKGRWLVWKTIPAPGYIGMDLNSRHHGEKAWKIVKKACSNFMWTAIPNVGHLYSVCGLPGPRRTLHKFLQGSFQVCIFYLFEICKVYFNLFQHHAKLQRYVDWNRVSCAIPPASNGVITLFDSHAQGALFIQSLLKSKNGHMLPTGQRYAQLRYTPPVVITWSLGGPTMGEDRGMGQC